MVGWGRSSGISSQSRVPPSRCKMSPGKRFLVPSMIVVFPWGSLPSSPDAPHGQFTGDTQLLILVARSLGDNLFFQAIVTLSQILLDNWFALRFGGMMGDQPWEVVVTIVDGWQVSNIFIYNMLEGPVAVSSNIKDEDPSHSNELGLHRDESKTAFGLGSKKNSICNSWLFWVFLTTPHNFFNFLVKLDRRIQAAWPKLHTILESTGNHLVSQGNANRDWVGLELHSLKSSLKHIYEVVNH